MKWLDLVSFHVPNIEVKKVIKSNKTKRINLRVTEKDYAKISKKAKMNMSQYVSLSALDRDFVIIEDL
jgi:predicted DNA binding CopG/RHH family protein